MQQSECHRVWCLAKRPTAWAWVRAALAAAALLAHLGGCATTSNLSAIEGRVNAVEQKQKVQDQRVGDVERGSASTIEQQQHQLDALIEQVGRLKQDLAELSSRWSSERDTIQQKLAAQEGSTRVLNEKAQSLGNEQVRLSDVLEKTQADLRTLRRRADEQGDQMKRFQAEQLAEMDAVTKHLAAVQLALNSPIGDLPNRTDADKLLRQAYGLVIHGELDLAADRFGEFMEKFPKDSRVPEAQYRQAQCYFLARKYDHAVVPAFALVDKTPNHALAPEARWLLARSLEEKGDFALARKFYSEMINSNGKYKTDAMRRVQFLNILQPAAEPAPAQSSGQPPAASGGANR
jgi:TolA-binding protein